MQGRFGNLQHAVESAAEEIQQLGLERGSEIGYDPLELSHDENEDEPPSKRTVDRLLRKNSKEVLKELKSLVIPSMSLPRPDNPVYEDDELLVLEAIAAIKLEAANNAGDSLADEKRILRAILRLHFMLMAQTVKLFLRRSKTLNRRDYRNDEPCAEKDISSSEAANRRT